MKQCLDGMLSTIGKSCISKSKNSFIKVCTRQWPLDKKIWQWKLIRRGGTLGKTLDKRLLLKEKHWVLRFRLIGRKAIQSSSEVDEGILSHWGTQSSLGTILGTSANVLWWLSCFRKIPLMSEMMEIRTIIQSNPEWWPHSTWPAQSELESQM